jgi:tRNA1(Val) A37 N6-methylase TrmN6
MDEAVASPFTKDAFFGGRLTLRQQAKGHRAGTDAVLLAAAVPRTFQGRVFDAGSGVGSVGLAIASVCPGATVTLIENDPTSVELAAANVADNALQDRVAAVACDLLSREERRARLPLPADLVVTNPPFHRSDRVRVSPDSGRRAAHVLADGASLAGWIEACLDCLGAKGSLIVLHHAAAVPELLDAVAPRLGDLSLMAIHPRSGSPAVRVLLKGTKGRRTPFRIAAPLMLHDGPRFTDHVAALHDGATALDW